jgi:SAM-dependent methyltransferase
MTFKDHFSSGSDGYARYRPRYPQALFAELADLAPDRHTAWDCATGTGQAAVALAEHFEHVVATDASSTQLGEARRHERVSYVPATAEHAPLRDRSIDLVVVAQALHWFDLEAFYAEVRRVLRGGGVIAAIAYGLHRISPGVDAVVDHLYRDLVGPYWPPERRHIETGYASLPFPFEPMPMGAHEMRAHWSLANLTGYLRTWSAVQRYRADRDEDPVTLIEAELAHAWGETGERRVTWPLTLRCGRA